MFQNDTFDSRSLSWTSGLLNLNMQFHPMKTISNEILTIIKQLKEAKNSPKVIIIGSGFTDYTISNNSGKALLEIERNMITIRHALEGMN